MSQTTTPDETETPNPVGAQEVSQGDTELAKQSQKAHDAALNGLDPKALEEAVTKAVRDQFAVTEGWQPKRTVKFIIDCPSGQPALVKHLDTKDLLRANLLEEMDRFTKELFPQIDQAGNVVEKEEDSERDGVWAILRSPEKRCKFFEMTNRLMCVAAIKPKIVNDGVALRTNEDGEQEEVFGCEVEDVDEQLKLFGKPVPKLKEDEAYAGAIDFADRMAFFQELNKPLGMIEPFREESDAVLECMEPIKSVELPPE